MINIKNKLQLFVTIVFLGFIAWWISFQHVVDKQGSSVNWFENAYGLVALIGSIIGIMAMRKWGGYKTLLGKSLLFFALGLFAQEVGQLVSSYYTQIAKESLPYPSLGDVAYFGSVLLYICAAIYLAKVVRVRFSLKQTGYKAVAVLVPIILLAISYFVLLHNHQYDTSKPLTVFLDAGYPIGQVCYISIAIVAYLLSKKMLGGIMRPAIVLVILALFVQYVSDFTFIYQSHRNAYVPGKFDDLFYLISYFVMSLALIKFLSVYKGLSNKTVASSTDKA
ncbi:MAG TPA: hypothetical protein VLF63_00590 [Patescibacteria group bacterium]|nr:hypothetical protein [Patescibacteria group bacterium]